MVEGAHTSEAIYGLRKAVGKGPRLWAGNIIIAADDDTLDTGLDPIEAISAMLVSDAAVDADTPIVVVTEISAAGIIKFHTGKLGAYGAVAATGYLMVIGVAR